MNAVVGFSCNNDDSDASYAVDFGRDRETTQKRSRYPDYRRKGSAPARVNGFHCRRNKRWTWGSGRGARMLDVRAFAGCLAVVAASFAATALGVTIDFRTIGNPGNPGNPSNTNLGSVSTVFRMAANETTNADYVEFLNKVDPDGTNSRLLYSGTMSTSTFGGVVLNGTAATGAKYQVKAGAPTGAIGGTTYGNMPVNFVTWFSAARYVNWLQNGQLSGTAGQASTETGAYTLNGVTSGTVIPSRNANATVFLPSSNEYYKAAFYAGSGTSYNLYGTGASTAPTATVSLLSSPNAGNYNNASTAGPLSVKSYAATTSFYGLYDLFGNVTEYLDSVSAGKVGRVGGNYLTLTSELTLVDANAAISFGSASALQPSLGFRVAAVPEPGTIALAGLGIAGLAGLDWLKRRRKKRLNEPQVVQAAA